LTNEPDILIKMFKYINIYLLSVLFTLSIGHAQVPDSVQLIKYTPEFEFADGLYLSFDQVKKNQPIPKSRIISSLDPNSRDFFDDLFAKENIYIYDTFGVKKTIKKKDVWGYSSNGFIYIQLTETFHRISFIGSICHFVADITVYSSYYRDPYYYNSYYYYSARPITTKSTELRQYLLDFKTGKVIEYTVEGLELLLMQDPELYDEYMSLRRKKKSQLKFLYIRKFNERNSLYLPVQ